MNFAKENDLLYIGESSALADINIKEVVETLIESKRTCNSLFYRDPRSLVESPRKQTPKQPQT